MKYLCCKSINALVIFLVLNLFLIFSAQSQIVTISDSSFQHASFDPINTLFNNVKVVGLGEATHCSGETMSAKVKMVKYLHEKCDFDILAFESAMYELSLVGEGLAKGEISKTELVNNLSGVWRVSELNELFDYILETQKTSRPLIYVGFDAKFFGNYSIGKDFSKDYSQFITKLSALSKTPIEVDSLFYKTIDYISNNSYSYKKIPPRDTLLLYNKFKEVKSILDSLKYKDDDYLYFWRQMTLNLQSIYRLNYHTGKRDYYMSQNVLYYRNKFPSKKIIVWSATCHLAGDLSSIDYYTKRNIANEMMGVHLKNALKDDYFAIGFAPYSGVVGMEGYLGLIRGRIRTKKTSIERYFHDVYGSQYGFINLRDTLIQQQIKDANLNYANLTGTDSKKMDIASVVDAIFYIETEKIIHWPKY